METYTDTPIEYDPRHPRAHEFETSFGNPRHKRICEGYARYTRTIRNAPIDRASEEYRKNTNGARSGAAN